MIINELKQNGLNRIEYDVLVLEYLLYQIHISLGYFFFLLSNHMIDVGNVLVIL